MVGVFFKGGGHAMTAYDYQMQGENMLVKLYDSNRLCEGILIDIGNNKIIGKKLSINANNRPIDTEIFYMDSYPIEDYLNLFNSKKDGKNNLLSAKRDQRLKIRVNGKDYILDENYEGGPIFYPRDGNLVSYEIPEADSIELSSSGDKAVDFFLVMNGQRYELRTDKMSSATIGNGKIDVKGQSGNYLVETTTDETSDAFKYDTVTVEGNNAGEISLAKTNRGYQLQGKNLKGAKVIERY